MEVENTLAPEAIHNVTSLVASGNKKCPRVAEKWEYKWPTDCDWWEDAPIIDVGTNRAPL